MTSHGFAASVGHGSGQIQIAGVNIAGNEPGSPQFRSAMQAQQAIWRAGLARFSACVRRKGVQSFPGPDSDGRLPLGTLGQSFFQSPAFQRAYAACKSLLPSGPGLPRIALP